MEQEKLDRINELARKAKTTALTEEERLEQMILREEYLLEFRASMRGILENTTIVSPDGKRTKLSERSKRSD